MPGTQDINGYSGNTQQCTGAALVCVMSAFVRVFPRQWSRLSCDLMTWDQTSAPGKQHLTRDTQGHTWHIQLLLVLNPVCLKLSLHQPKAPLLYKRLIKGRFWPTAFYSVFFERPTTACSSSVQPGHMTRRSVSKPFKVMDCRTSRIIMGQY